MTRGVDASRQREIIEFGSLLRGKNGAGHKRSGSGGGLTLDVDKRTVVMSVMEFCGRSFVRPQTG